MPHTQKAKEKQEGIGTKSERGKHPQITQDPKMS